VDKATQSPVTNIVREYGDCFDKQGATRPIIGYEFGIDTGNTKPVCCKKPSYGFYESKVIMTQVAQLLWRLKKHDRTRVEPH